MKRLSEGVWCHENKHLAIDWMYLWLIVLRVSYCKWACITVSLILVVLLNLWGHCSLWKFTVDFLTRSCWVKHPRSTRIFNTWWLLLGCICCWWLAIWGTCHTHLLLHKASINQEHIWNTQRTWSINRLFIIFRKRSSSEKRWQRRFPRLR